nr:TIM barrel protein [uncultured Actinotalea sp.]
MDEAMVPDPVAPDRGVPLLRGGLCSVTFRTLRVAEVARRAREAGLAAVEWGTDVHVPLGDPAAQAGVRALAAEHGPAVASLGSYLRFDVPTVDDGVALLAATARTGAPRVRVWAGSAGSADATRAGRDAVVGGLRDLADAAADAAPGLVIGLELHDGTLADEEEAAARLLDEVDRPAVGAYWQPGVGLPDERALAGLRLLADRVVAVHAFSWWPGDERLPLSRRAGLWRAVLALLHERGRPTDVLLEFVPGDDPDVLPREAATLRDLIEETR